MLCLQTGVAVVLMLVGGASLNNICYHGGVTVFLPVEEWCHFEYLYFIGVCVLRRNYFVFLLLLL
jgi:hypothetical protein